jgi:hypothetical protein
MPTETDIERTILNGSYALGTLTSNNYNLINRGALPVRENFIQFFRLNLQALEDQYELGDYTSSNTVTIYDRINSFIGIPANATLDPNFQNPGIVYNVTTVIQATGNFTRIPFNGVTNVSLANFQSTYALIYGSDAIVTIWVTTDNFATVQQDTGTVPTITNLGGDINKPNDYEWVYPFATSGYIQINGFTPQGGNTSAGLPITNNSSVLLSDATLNGLYPTALWGQIILLPNVPCKYVKLDNSPTGQWDLQTYTPNT